MVPRFGAGFNAVQQLGGTLGIAVQQAFRVAAALLAATTVAAALMTGGRAH